MRRAGRPGEYRCRGSAQPDRVPGRVLLVLRLIQPNATALALDGHARDAGTASGVLGLAQYVIGAAAAPLVGVAGPRTGLPMAMIICVLGVSARLCLPRAGPTAAPAA